MDFIAFAVLLSYRPPVENDVPLYSGAPYSNTSEVSSSTGHPKKRRAGRPRRANGQDYDTDYNSSGDELDDNDFDRYRLLTKTKCSALMSADGLVSSRRPFLCPQ